MRLRRAVLQIPPKPPVPPRLPLYKSHHSLTRLESTLPQVLIPLHFISFIGKFTRNREGGPLLPAPKFCNSSPLLPNLSFRAQRGIRCFLLPSLCLCLITSLHPWPLRATATPQPVFFHALTHTSRRNGGWVIMVDQVGQPILAVSSILPSLHPQLPVRPFSADSASLRYPFPFPVSRPSTFNCQLSASSSGQELPDQICYRPLAPVFARQPTRHSERSEESLFSGCGKDRHAQAPKQGAEEKWQSAPYL
jgi:hypothetical protein